MPDFLKAHNIQHWFQEGMANRWGKFQPNHTKNKTKMQGFSRHSDEELWEFSNEDFSSISEYLGNNPFFFGDRLTLVDCAIFGHFLQFLWIPIDFPKRKFSVEQCSNVVDLLNRFQDKYWPDWKELCATTI